MSRPTTRAACWPAHRRRRRRGAAGRHPGHLPAAAPTTAAGTAPPRTPPPPAGTPPTTTASASAPTSCRPARTATPPSSRSWPARRSAPCRAHSDDQLAPYANLVYNYTGLTGEQINTFFNDSSYGVAAGQTSSSTVLAALGRHDRARQGNSASRTSPAPPGPAPCTAPDTPGAQDRLFLMDLMRHVGPGQADLVRRRRRRQPGARAERLAQLAVHRGGPAGADRRAAGAGHPRRAALRRRAGATSPASTSTSPTAWPPATAPASTC